jgi:hypothetical protein
MSVNNTNFRADFQSFRTQANAAGLNLQQIRQDAIQNGQDPQAAISAAVQQAAQNPNAQNGQALTESFGQVQKDKATMKANGMGMHRHGHHHGGPKGAGGATQTDPTSNVDSSDPTSITNAISSLNPSDPNYTSQLASLQSMLLTAQNQNPTMAGTSLNYTA